MRTASRKIRALNFLEIIPQRLRENTYGFSANQQLYKKNKEHWTKVVPTRVNINAASTKRKHRSIANRWVQCQVYSVSVHMPKEEQGKTL